VFTAVTPKDKIFGEVVAVEAGEYGYGGGKAEALAYSSAKPREHVNKKGVDRMHVISK
jgi:hypothetical protein